MPHRHGDPIPRMSENQLRVYKAYGSIPVWLDDNSNIVCTYCNQGNAGCAQGCLLAGVMQCMRNDIKFLDDEASRKETPVTPEEMKEHFRVFCRRQDVAAVVPSEQLYESFVTKSNIVLVLQSLGPWLRGQAERYAKEGGVHNQPRDRLLLKCERAVTLFLRLELNSLSLEDTIILCNIIESAGSMEAQDEVLHGRLQKAMDLISVAHAFKEMQGRSSTLKNSLMKGGSSSGEFVDDPKAPRRCHGRTQSGARCKLTELSVQKLHGKCADAAKPLQKGAKFCKFHRDQEFM